jgi:hypothetical protein
VYAIAARRLPIVAVLTALGPVACLLLYSNIKVDSEVAI